MLNIDKTKFDIKIFEEEIDGFVGVITNPTMDTIIYLKPMHCKFEKYGIIYMEVNYNNDETSLSNYEVLIENCPDELKEQCIKQKDGLVAMIKRVAFISADCVSIEKLKKKDKYVISFIYHELGHFVNSDKSYSETQNDRQKAILEGRILERELDADDYAYSVMGEVFYDALREQELNFSKAAQYENDQVFMMDFFESHLRAERIAQVIISERHL